jgi:hypothetical protein
MTPQELETAVRRLIDKDEIVDLVLRYSFLFDHGPVTDVPLLFTEDCIVDYGPGIAPVVHGRAAFAAMLSAENPDAFLATSHNNANVLVEFAGPDRAEVKTSLYAWHRPASGPQPQVWGYYFDEMVRTPDGWRIAKRQLRISGEENFPIAWRPLRDPE